MERQQHGRAAQPPEKQQDAGPEGCRGHETQHKGAVAQAGGGSSKDRRIAETGQNTRTKDPNGTVVLNEATGAFRQDPAEASGLLDTMKEDSSTGTHGQGGDDDSQRQEP